MEGTCESLRSRAGRGGERGEKETGISKDPHGRKAAVRKEKSSKRMHHDIVHIAMGMQGHFVCGLNWVTACPDI